MRICIVFPYFWGVHYVNFDLFSWLISFEPFFVRPSYFFLLGKSERKMGLRRDFFCSLRLLTFYVNVYYFILFSLSVSNFYGLLVKLSARFHQTFLFKRIQPRSNWCLTQREIEILYNPKHDEYLQENVKKL